MICPEYSHSHQSNKKHHNVVEILGKAGAHSRVQRKIKREGARERERERKGGSGWVNRLHLTNVEHARPAYRTLSHPFRHWVYCIAYVTTLQHNSQVTWVVKDRLYTVSLSYRLSVKCSR
jgi:hypothetical protein